MWLCLIDNWKAALDNRKWLHAVIQLDLPVSKAKLKAYGVAKPGVALMQNYDL